MRQVVSTVLGLGLLATATAPLWAGDAAETRQILDKAIKAAGGAAKVAKLRNVTWKGTANIEEGGMQATITHEGSSQGWDKYRVDLTAQIGGRNEAILMVLNGDKAWASKDGKVKEAPAKEIGVVRDFFYAWRVVQMLPALKDKAVKLSHLGEVKVGDRPAVGLLVSQTGRPDVSLFFDKENSLPLKSVVRLKVPNDQEKELEYLFSAYKDFDGLKHFTKITFRADSKEYVTELSEIRTPAELDATLFAKPE
jgi:hypothetical protein